MSSCLWALRVRSDNILNRAVCGEESMMFIEGVSHCLVGLSMLFSAIKKEKPNKALVRFLLLDGQHKQSALHGTRDYELEKARP